MPGPYLSFTCVPAGTVESPTANTHNVFSLCEFSRYRRIVTTESDPFMPRVTIEPDRCKGCELCVQACPQQIIEMSKKINAKGYFYATVFDQPRCIGCRLCAITCPDVAIEIGVNAVQYNYFPY